MRIAIPCLSLRLTQLTYYYSLPLSLKLSQQICTFLPTRHFLKYHQQINFTMLISIKLTLQNISESVFNFQINESVYIRCCCLVLKASCQPSLWQLPNAFWHYGTNMITSDKANNCNIWPPKMPPVFSSDNSTLNISQRKYCFGSFEIHAIEV